MMRLFTCAALALLIGAGASLSPVQGQDKGKGKGKGRGGQVGTVQKIDAATGTLTVKVGRRDNQTEKTFKVSDTTKCFCFKENKREAVTTKDALKELKKGDRVRVQADKDGNVTQLTINPPMRRPKGG